MERHTDDEARPRPDSSAKLNRGHRTVRTTVSTGSDSNVVDANNDDEEESSSSREVAETETETDAEADTPSHDEAEADISRMFSCWRKKSHQPHKCVRTRHVEFTICIRIWGSLLGLLFRTPSLFFLAGFPSLFLVLFVVLGFWFGKRCWVTSVTYVVYCMWWRSTLLPYS